MAIFDLTIIGGGIIGLATARQVLLRHPKLRVCVLEKELELATHQSKRNSGVIHSGVYYKKGSLKSKLCIKGAQLAKEYCQRKNLPYKQCGKLIVATDLFELGRLHDLHKNCLNTGIPDIELIGKEQIETIQPGCSQALEALWSPNTAIVDWQAVALSYAKDFEQMGGTVVKGFVAKTIKPVESKDGPNLIIESVERDEKPVETQSIVNSTGVYSDYFCRLTGNPEHPKVVPFRGNYFVLSDRLSGSVRTNIYPVPDPKLPFLGVHLTPRLDGSVLIGPTSVLALGYEKYQPEDDIYLGHLYHILIRSGFLKMIRNKDNFKAGIFELLRMFSKRLVAHNVSRLYPDIKTSDLIDTKFCGIRAQVIEKDGALYDDFLFETGALEGYQNVLHIRNCPSPAATSSLAIAERVSNILEERLI